MAAIAGYNAIGLFHGHQHETPMIYRGDGLELIKAQGGVPGGLCRGTHHRGFSDVVLGEAADGKGVLFTHAFSKTH